MPTGTALSRCVYVDCVSVYGAVHGFYTPEVVVAADCYFFSLVKKLWAVVDKLLDLADV